MLVQHLCEYADRRLSLPPPSYLLRPVRYVIDLDAAGNTHGNPLDTADPSNRSTENGTPRIVPHLKKAQGTRPRLLSDVREYVFGVAEPGKESRARERHAAFMQLLEECASQTREPLVAAVPAFFNRLEGNVPEWAQDLDPTALITFRVNDTFPIDLPSVRAFWATRQGETTAAAESPMSCIACGNTRPPLRRHPLKIRGVPNGQLSGTDLISANNDAFVSFGLANSLIAPTCFPCAWKYGNALNALLEDDDTHLRLGAVVYAFWTVEETAFLPGKLLSEPNSAEVKELLNAVRSGKSAAVDIDPTAFYSVGLTGSGARVAVTSWLDTTVGEAKLRLGRYFALQEMEEWDGQPGTPISVRRLANATVRNARKDTPPAGVTDSLIELALAGRRLPEDVLFRAIQRCRASQGVSRERAALIKLALGSEQGWTEERTETMSGLDTTNHDPAYLCGRLMAVLDAIQRRAISPNATVVDRFYGAASSAPASVFGNLLDNAQKHLAKLRKNPRSTGAGNALDGRLMDVMEGLEEFPPMLTLPQQAMFALGFYHQRAADRRAAREWSDEHQQADDNNDTPDASAGN